MRIDYDRELLIQEDVRVQVVYHNYQTKQLRAYTKVVDLYYDLYYGGLLYGIIKVDGNFIRGMSDNMYFPISNLDVELLQRMYRLKNEN